LFTGKEVFEPQGDEKKESRYEMHMPQEAAHYEMPLSSDIVSFRSLCMTEACNTE